MGKLFKYIALPLLSALALASCEEKEPALTEKLSELKAYPGLYRTKLEFKAPSQAVKARVFFNAGKVEEFAIDPSAELQSYILDSLEANKEGEQTTIRVETVNAEGTRSYTKGAKVHIWGSDFLAGRINRTILEGQASEDGNLNIVFGEKEPFESAVVVKYTTLGGQSDSTILSGDDNTLNISNIDFSKPYTYYTIYKPSEDFIDDYRMPGMSVKDAMTHYNKNTWKVAQVSSEAPGSEASKLFDDDANTVWSTAGESSGSVVIDLRAEKPMIALSVIQSQSPKDDHYSADFTLELSSDGSSYREVLSGALQPNGYKQVFKLPQSEVFRFARLNVLKAGAKENPGTKAQASGGSVSIAEVDFIKEDEVSGNADWPEFDKSIVNGKKPFKNHLITVQNMGNRFGQLEGWNHSDPTNISYDSADGSFVLWSASPWGVPDPKNAKLWQTMDLLPGLYQFNVSLKHTSITYAPGIPKVFVVVAEGDALPDFNSVKSSETTLSYLDAVANQNKDKSLLFTVSARQNVSMGFVYNLNAVYVPGVWEYPWCDFYISSVSISPQ